ncbi:MAG: hypothetical protein H6R04_1076 [Burkholderiaceae bacterium]|nr:hypothetical protein [Burkholderiaceae bacterium]
MKICCKWKLLVTSVALAAMQTSANAVDSVSLEYGSGSNARLERVALQWNWSQRWFASNGNHIGGYWDLSLARGEERKHRNIEGARRNIYGIGITPVFRWQQDNKKGFYAEAGIGAHLMSHTSDNAGNQLSTAFQFGDHLGVGYVFGNGLDLGLKLQHFSNGGIKKPNTGANFAIMRASYAF